MSIDTCTLDDVFGMVEGGCEEPGCTHEGEQHGPLVLHSACHPSMPTWLVIDAAARTLEVICAKCRRPILKIDTRERSS